MTFDRRRAAGWAVGIDGCLATIGLTPSVDDDRRGVAGNFKVYEAAMAAQRL